MNEGFFEGCRKVVLSRDGGQANFGKPNEASRSSCWLSASCLGQANVLGIDGRKVGKAPGHGSIVG
jgi:hypothetical protein